MIDGEYKTSFKAPSQEGVYYVHIEIKSQEFAFSGEKNINVLGKDGSDQASTQNVNSRAEAIISEKISDKQSFEENKAFENSQLKEEGLLQAFWKEILNRIIFFFGKICCLLISYEFVCKLNILSNYKRFSLPLKATYYFYQHEIGKWQQPSC